MRKSILPFVLALVFVQALRAGGPTLLGTVRDRHTGKAVSSAAIQIIDSRGIQLGTTLSNSLGQWTFTVPLTGVSGEDVPHTFSIDQNYPNPFNPSTKIPFSVGHEGRVRMSVYNILGQVVVVLADGIQQAGYKQVEWRADGFPSGVYFYRLEAVSTWDPQKTFTQVRKMLMVR